MKLIIENLDEILPIIIFIIVAISSVFTSMKKGRRDEDEEQQSPDAPPPPAPAPAPRPTQQQPPERRAVERPERLSDEMRKALEDIFEAKKPQPARTPARAAAKSTARPHEHDEWAKSVAEREAKNVRRDAQKAAQKAAARTQPEIQGMGPADKPGNTLAAQARSGIVWSEILQPPVSMR